MATPFQVGRNRVRSALLALVLAALAPGLLATVVPGSRLSAAEPAAKAKPAAVRLVISYGDGVEVHFTQLAWREGMTVLDALTAASKHRHGVSISVRGSGSNAMIKQIGDQKNEGDGRNWLFSVNGKTAEVGAGAATLAAGDSILWEFKTYEYNP